jgi:hypothetical protein
MAHSWGPVEKPVEHNVQPIAADGAEGKVTEPHPDSREANPRPNENYNATDGRHNKADHQGWPSIDGNSGETSQTDFADKSGRFPDGPGPWRQT